jgi:hypothetical protein
MTNGDHHDQSPPEPGFARREAHTALPNLDHLGRLLKRSKRATNREEGHTGKQVPP